jgi:hypothetical protein
VEDEGGNDGSYSENPHVRARAKLDGDMLTLSTPPMLFEGLQQTVHLVWQKIAS